MIIDFKNELVFIATKKTASTSIEKRIRPLGYCGFIGGPPVLKHLTFQQFKEIRHGLGLENFKTWCVVRNPVQKSISWYNYRSRKQIRNSARYLGDISYSAYLTRMTDEDRLECDDSKSITDNNNQKVDIVFDMSQFGEIEKFLNEIYNVPELSKLNSSASYNRSYRPTALEIAKAKIKLRKEIKNYNKLKKFTAAEAIKLLRE